MALIKCPECGRENVSDTALACPSCGFGIKIHYEKIKAEAKLLEQKRLEQEQAERDRIEKLRIEQQKRLAIAQRDASEAQEEKEETEKWLASIKIPKKHGIGFGWFLILFCALSMFVIFAFLGSFSAYLPADVQKSHMYITILTSVRCDFIVKILADIGINEQGIDYCCIGFGIATIVLFLLAQNGKRRKNKDYYTYIKIGESKYREQKLKESGWVSEVSKRREERERQRLRELQIAKQMEEQARRMEMEKNQKKEVAKYFPVQTNRIHCPTCNSTNVERINVLNRALSFELVGFASNKIGKQFQCKNCKYLW